MSNAYKTPGVYINEKNAFPNSVVAVDTAVPVFIGYTEIAKRLDRSVAGLPVKINSLSEYECYYGKRFRHVFGIDGSTKTATEPVRTITNFRADNLKLLTARFHLYDCMRFFFMNGGNACYIFSLGEYGENESLKIDFDDIKKQKVFEQLEKEMELTLIVMPDFANPREREKCYALYNDVLNHCLKMKSRMGIFDVIPKDGETLQDTVDHFRSGIGNEGLCYGAAYYPWLNTSVVDVTEVDFTNLDIAVEDLLKLLPEPVVKSIITNWEKPNDGDTAKERAAKINLLQDILIMNSGTYKQVITAIRNVLNLLPPAAAMAGIYNSVDQSRGVWKAPANVSVNSVVSPAKKFSDQEQEGMNVDALGGKSINVIREFFGKGTLVWGARTLVGNNQEWRYINVRRTLIMIEQSVAAAMKAYVFEPNEQNTWVMVKSMIENFLTNLWKQGALTGVKPDEAFFVSVGLGQTMTADDIAKGRLLLTIGVAMLRPAEFIILTLEQQQAG